MSAILIGGLIGLLILAGILFLKFRGDTHPSSATPAVGMPTSSAVPATIPAIAPNAKRGWWWIVAISVVLIFVALFVQRGGDVSRMGTTIADDHCEKRNQKGECIMYRSR